MEVFIASNILQVHDVLGVLSPAELPAPQCICISWAEWRAVCYICVEQLVQEFDWDIVFALQKLYGRVLEVWCKA